MEKSNQSFPNPTKAMESFGPGREDESKRTLFSKSFRRGNGTGRVVIHGEPIHCLDLATGSLTDPADGRVPGSADVRIDADPSSDRVFSVAKGQARATLRMPAIRQKLLSGRSVLTCRSKAEARYFACPSGVKEEIVIPERTGEYSFNFALELEGLEPILREDGAIVLRDASTGAPSLLIPKPFMRDSAGEMSDAVSISVRPVSGGLELGLEADAAWIEEPGRAFPIVIDPQVVEDLEVPVTVQYFK